jgi:hypothetical protein
VEVVLDGARAHEQLRGDLDVGRALRDKFCDLGLLGRQIVGRVGRPLARTLSRRTQLDPCAFGERLTAELREEVVGSA